MSRLNQIVAILLLGILSLVQSGLPALLGELWAGTAMFLAYEQVMDADNAIELVLRGDLGCGFFPELEALNQETGALTFAWVSTQVPVLPMSPRDRTDVPYPNSAGTPLGGPHWSRTQQSFPVDTPPPRQV
jgi:hypothetical protein